MRCKSVGYRLICVNEQMMLAVDVWSLAKQTLWCVDAEESRHLLTAQRKMAGNSLQTVGSKFNKSK